VWRPGRISGYVILAYVFVWATAMLQPGAWAGALGIALAAWLAVKGILVVFAVFPGCTVQVPDWVASTFESLLTVKRGIPAPPAPVPVETFVPPNWVTFVEAFEGGVVVTVPETAPVHLSHVVPLKIQL
jgi:hypothetical protein